MVEFTDKLVDFGFIIGDVDTFTGLLNAELDVRGWSISEFARRAGMSQSTASDVANGKVDPSPKVAMLTADAFGDAREEWLRIAGHLPPQPVAREDHRALYDDILKLPPEAVATVRAMVSGLATAQREPAPTAPAPQEEREPEPEPPLYPAGGITDIRAAILDQLESYVGIQRPAPEVHQRLTVLFHLVQDALAEYEEQIDASTPANGVRPDNLGDVPGGRKRAKPSPALSRD